MLSKAEQSYIQTQYSIAEQSKAKISKAKFLNMDHQKAVSLSRLMKLVPNDLFDKQMKRARQRDINSRQIIFDRQTEDGIEKRNKRRNIKLSIY